MPIKAPDMSFQPVLKNVAQLVAFSSALFAGYQEAAVIKANEIAALNIPDREERQRIFDAYTEQTTKATKALLTERLSIADEAAGIGAALDLMAISFKGVRGEL